MQPAERAPLTLATRVNEVWSMDFARGSLANGGYLKFLSAADDFSHEAVDIAVDYGISRQYVTRPLDCAATLRVQHWPTSACKSTPPDRSCSSSRHTGATARRIW